MKEQSMCFCSGYGALREKHQIPNRQPWRGNPANVTKEWITAPPAVTVGTFALECGFKFSICMDQSFDRMKQLRDFIARDFGKKNINKKLHDVEFLFGLPSTDTQDFFRSKFQAPASARMAHSGDESFIWLYDDKSSAGRTFDEELARVKDDFVEFRYRFEKPLEVNLTFLDFMIKRLLQLLLEDDTAVTLTSGAKVGKRVE